MGYSTVIWFPWVMGPAIGPGLLSQLLTGPQAIWLIKK